VQKDEDTTENDEDLQDIPDRITLSAEEKRQLLTQVLTLCCYSSCPQFLGGCVVFTCASAYLDMSTSPGENWTIKSQFS
jgi:hypothetical protein